MSYICTDSIGSRSWRWKRDSGLRGENPAAGQVRVSNELRKHGIIVSPSGVRSVWLRHTLQTFRLRLAALEKKSAEQGLVLTEIQVAALERKRRSRWNAVRSRPRIPATSDPKTRSAGFPG
jgi:hypothetical protein